MTKIANIFNCKTAALVGLAFLTVACATTNKSDSRDPWEGFNRNVQSFNDGLDDYVMKPVARGYQTVTPKFVDLGISNFFSNIDDIAVIANDLLQFKLKETGMDTGRLLINTTTGLAGFVDVASHLDLPKHNEDLDQTLGKWGIPSGPYLVLPLIGPSTPRGVVGLAGDTMSNPINWITPVAIPYGAGTLKTIDMRADRLTESKILDEASVDRYEFIRNAYFQDRDYKIHDGNPPPNEEDLQMEKEMDALEHLDGNKAPSNSK
ncbi:MAG: ABC transporter [Candidatus Methylumidiphilus alinenensis]|uniref:ABC transporter n=1 Tax=Candidatus Methylumidiphilus alinenensis TaxID=2202197 RepID=A0A2W4S7A9_9GAMM|nr:MAG: ABC transporter [Candidatus Methylumidiphilus alinenensis]